MYIRIEEGGKGWKQIPQRWTNETIVYIYKNKGGAGEFGNYRPICVTQIIYKISPGPIARKLTKISHILTRNNRYGYKEGISTIGAIIKVEQYIEQEERKDKVLLMGPSEAFGTINRAMLWETLYKKGTPGEMIGRIGRGQQGTRMASEYNGGYGESHGNNIGVSRGSPISALLCYNMRG